MAQRMKTNLQSTRKSLAPKTATPRGRFTKKCAECKLEFQAKDKTHKYCETCHIEWKKRHVPSKIRKAFAHERKFEPRHVRNLAQTILQEKPDITINDFVNLFIDEFPPVEKKKPKMYHWKRNHNETMLEVVDRCLEDVDWFYVTNGEIPGTKITGIDIARSL